MARVTVKIYIPCPKRASYEVVPICGVKESEFNGRRYLWPERCPPSTYQRLPSNEHLSEKLAVEEGAIIAVYGHCKVSRKHGYYFVMVLRAREGAKAEADGDLLAENAELLALVYEDEFGKVAEEMAKEGYAVARYYDKQVANIAAWIAAKHLPQTQQEDKTASVAEQLEELLKEIEEAGEEQSEKEQQSQQGKQEEKGVEEQRREQEDRCACSVDLDNGYITLPNGTVLVRLWLARFMKPSEYLGQHSERKANGKDEVVEERKLHPVISRIAERLRKAVLREMVTIPEAVKMEAVFGKNSGMWLVLSQEGVEKLKQLAARAKAMLTGYDDFQKLPAELQKRLEERLKLVIEEWWLPAPAAINILRQLKTDLSEAKETLQAKLNELQRRQAREQLRRLEQLTKQLQLIEQQLKRLEQLAGASH